MIEYIYGVKIILTDGRELFRTGSFEIEGESLLDFAVKHEINKHKKNG